MRQLFYFAALVLAALTSFAAGSGQALAATPPIRVGLFPFHSPQHLIAQKEPFRRHLEKSLRRAVHLETAPGLEIFMQRLSRGEYDIALLPAHFGRIAQQDYHWRLVAKYVPDMTVYIVTRKQGGVRSVAELKGAMIATHDRALLLSMVADRWLKKNGLAENAVEWMETGGLANSVYAVVAGQADAAIASSSSLGLTPQAELDQLRVLAEAGAVPQPFVLANPHMNREALARLQSACDSFVEDGHKAFTAVAPGDLRILDRYTAEAREQVWGRPKAVD